MRYRLTLTEYVTGRLVARRDFDWNFLEDPRAEEYGAGVKGKELYRDAAYSAGFPPNTWRK